MADTSGTIDAGNDAGTTPVRTARLIAAGMIGNVLEWYDFAVYGYLAVAIGQNFFPHDDPGARLLATFGVFAIGYFMRPIGGIIIGHIGDRHSRRAALAVSVTLMAIPTFLIGVMPTYETIGLAAPLLLTLLRMLQGLSVGGEYTSSMVFLVEHARMDRRALYGSFSTIGAVSGVLLGSAIATAISVMLPPEALTSWGWRIPFLFGPLIGVAGFILRRQMAESMPEAHPGVHPPVVVAFRNHWRLMLRIIGLSMVTAIGFYVLFVYVANWMQSADHLSAARALEINTINMALLLPMMLAGAVLSDRIGRKPVMTVSVVLMGLTAWPLFWLMYHPSAWLAFLGQLGFVLIWGGFFGCIAAVLVEAVPLSVRCTAVSLGYNTCLGIAGGTAPLVAAWLVTSTGNPMAPAFYIIASAIITLISLTTFKETYRSPLPQ